MDRKVKPLYRPENKTTICRKSYVDRGGEFRHSRNTKRFKTFEGKRQSMKSGQVKGRDYTPLFMFLLSRIGSNWDDVYSMVISRLDSTVPVWLMVSEHEKPERGIVRLGESSYYSKLYIDEEGFLRKVQEDHEIVHELCSLISCDCCTYTFNGKPFSSGTVME